MIILYKRKMEKRVKHLEEAIQSHCEILIFETGEDGERALEDLTIRQKLKMLILNQGKIMKSKMRGNNIRM